MKSPWKSQLGNCNDHSDRHLIKAQYLPISPWNHMNFRGIWVLPTSPVEHPWHSWCPSVGPRPERPNSPKLGDFHGPTVNLPRGVHLYNIYIICVYPYAFVHPSIWYKNIQCMVYPNQLQGSVNYWDFHFWLFSVSRGDFDTWDDLTEVDFPMENLG